MGRKGMSDNDHTQAWWPRMRENGTVEHVPMSQRDFERFVEALDDDTEPSEKLKELFRDGKGKKGKKVKK
jgi:hypothetical protein